MSEWFQSLKGVITERVSSPIVFAYAIAWLFLNYQVVFMAFSSADVMEKITFVPAHYGDLIATLYYLGVPLIIALFYTIAMPWVAHLTLMYTLWQGRFTRKMKIEYEQSTLITTGERDQLISLHQETLDRLHAEMSKRALSYTDLIREKEDLTRAVVEATKANSEIEEKLTVAKSECSALKLEYDRLVGTIDVEKNRYAELFSAILKIKTTVAPLTRAYKIAKPVMTSSDVQVTESAVELLRQLGELKPLPPE